MIKSDKIKEDEPKKRVMLKGVTRNMKIALNTIHQAVKMVERAGVELDWREEESEDDVKVTIRFKK